ncbi:hypothetical protein T484DRAFT_1782510 [Baffinella frigidus]|nr:hypothetical protein T484DRAFT_1782510 [Cryptophyta sp. CCMP2293]
MGAIHDLVAMGRGSLAGDPAAADTDGKWDGHGSMAAGHTGVLHLTEPEPKGGRGGIIGGRVSRIKPSDDPPASKPDFPIASTAPPKEVAKSGSGWRAAIARSTSALSIRGMQKAVIPEETSIPNAKGYPVRYNGGLFIQTRDSLALQMSGSGQKLPPASTEFVWGGENEMDCKGLLFYLGSNGRAPDRSNPAKDWSNPVDRGHRQQMECSGQD